MGCHFMRIKCVGNAQTVSEEPVTCIAVKEDRHQNIMRNVALKKGLGEPWTIGRVAKFIDLLGYREILQSSRSEIVLLKCAKQESPQRTQ